MGMSVAEGKEVVITDNKNIKTSDLNNCFLFRKKHIGLSRSKYACTAGKKINPNFNCKDLQNLNYIKENRWKILSSKLYYNHR